MSLTGQVPEGPAFEFRRWASFASPPSLGQIVVSDLPDGAFQVDSFFDIFTEISLDGGDFLGGGDATRVQMQGEIVPEPSALALLSLAGLALAVWRKNRVF
jgi:hypothetical protein